MNADGTGQVNLASNAADELMPMWSPDGAKIAFQSTRDNERTGLGRIYVMKRT